MNDDEDDFVDDIEDEEIEKEAKGEMPLADELDSRRKLEDRLEERRLLKLTQDYDFD